MRPRPRVLFASAELTPFSQRGGLGDVARELPRALAGEGVSIDVVTPLHRVVRPQLPPVDREVSFSFHFGERRREARLLRAAGSPDEPRIHFLEAPELFETEDDIYGFEAGPDGLGDLRYLGFAAALRPAARALGGAFDVLHLNDWHTALAAPLFLTDGASDPAVKDTAVVFTVHNAAFRGLWDPHAWHRTGLRDDLLNAWHLLHDEQVDLLKGGVVFADMVSTVSPTYARELKGVGGGPLAGIFEARRDEFVGIVNGIDGEDWNPAADPALPHAFDADAPGARTRVREALIRELGLTDGVGPLLGFVGRLTEQKGVDVLAEALPRLLERKGVGLVVLGHGGDAGVAPLRSLSAAHPHRVAFREEFNPGLARRVFGGVDFLLVPSRFEPCGLVQMIAHRYGALPIAHAVGGLVDTITPHGRRRNVAADGFLFESCTADALVTAVDRALKVFRRPATMVRLRKAAMTRDHSWKKPSWLYLDLYGRAMAAARRGAHRRALREHLHAVDAPGPLPEQKPLPGHFDRDILFLGLQTPRRLWAHWEVQGAVGKALLDGLTDAQKWSSRWELRVEHLETGHRWSLPVDGLAKNWFFDVEPHRTYRAELWMTADGREAERVLTSNEVEVPPEAPSP